MRKKWAMWLAGLMMVFGLTVLLYPTISSLINRQNGSYAIQELQQRIDGMDLQQMESALREAEIYNERLTNLNEEPNTDGYDQILDFGNGIMGYITIEKINVKLPIYHGVSSEVLEKGVGHLPHSAFPVGGTGNHSVLTGHTGLPSAELFTDLTELTEGDQFEVSIGNLQVLYQVDQIRIVLPNETKDLMPIPGEDYCTLVTCTPYGVNSHRLLVRGKRVELVEDATEAIPQQPESESNTGNRWPWLLVIPIVVLPVFIKRKWGRHHE